MYSTSPSSPQVNLTSLCVAAIVVVVIVMVLLRIQFDWYKTRSLLIWRRLPISCVSLLAQSLGAQIKDELRSMCGPPDTQGGPDPLPTQVGAPLFIAVIFAHHTTHLPPTTPPIPHRLLQTFMLTVYQLHHVARCSTPSGLVQWGPLYGEGLLGGVVIAGIDGSVAEAQQ